MLKHFPIPENADTKSVKAIEHFKMKLEHTTITKPEIDFIIRGVMKAQEPRDRERAKKAAEKEREREEKQRRLAELRRR